MAFAGEEGEQTWVFQADQDCEQRRAQPRKAHAALLVLGTLAVAAGAAAWRGGNHADIASKSGSFMIAAEEARICKEFPGLRLADGHDALDAVLNIEADACVKRCEADADCRQVVFSHGNSGCYRFSKANALLYSGAGTTAFSEFTSALCSSADDEEFQSVTLQLRAQQIALVKKTQYDKVQQNWTASIEKAKALVATLTLEQKVSILHGDPNGMGYAGFLKSSPPINGMMNLQMNDGPQGYNTYQATLAGTSTQLPCLLSVAASFSREVSAAYAGVVAEEFVMKGGNVLLGPDVEVMRAPLTGRGFETISGEDPYLGAALVAPFVQEVQKHGVIATVKHWLDNNQEIYRQTMNVEVADRTQHEIYMAPFKAAFDAGAAAVMCSYNKVYGTHACENKKLLKKLLRKHLGFKGFVVSDWGATHNAAKSANSGLDIEMPAGGTFLNLTDLVMVNKTVSKNTVDEMAIHVISAMYAVGHFDGAFPLENVAPRGHMQATTPEHDQVAYRTIVESAVLLKNQDETLPFDVNIKKIAMVGRFCNHVFEKSYAQGSTYSGGGSGFVNTTRERTFTPVESLKHMMKGTGVDVTYGVSGKAAKGADVAVICLAAHSEEGWDRANLTVPQEATDLIADVKKHGGLDQKIVVLLMAPGAVETEWAADVNAVLLMFMPGEEVGKATAALLTGREAPGGRLPISLPKAGENRFEQYQYPGVCAGNTWCDKMTANFTDGVLVGYRWNDAKGVPAAYPFGFGLTYTQFALSRFSAKCMGKNKAMVSLRVTNTGARDGQAVPQLYVGFPSLAPALRQLRGFQKVTVGVGQEADVVFVLGGEDWSYFSEDKDGWVSAMESGEDIEVSLGSSSSDLQWSDTIKCSSNEAALSL